METPKSLDRQRPSPPSLPIIRIAEQIGSDELAGNGAYERGRMCLMGQNPEIS
jgi:hypothetical protein